MENLKGKLLIAIPQLPDENFFRTVVLVLKHTDDGALGLVLNRPTPVSLDKVWKSVSGDDSDSNDPIYLGGPVQGPLMALHCQFSQGEEDVMPGVFYSVRREQLDNLIRDQKKPLRVFTGHSGWGAGQLECEIEAGGWLVLDATYEHVFDSGEELWKNACEQVGASILVDKKYQSRISGDPSNN